MLALLTAALLAQPVEVSVVLSRRISVPSEKAAKLLEQLRSALDAGAAPTVPRAETDARLGRLGLSDATFCAGKRSCLAELGKQLPSTVVVGLSLSEVKPDFAVNVEAVNADGTLLARVTAISPSDQVDASDTFTRFARELAAAIGAPAPKPMPKVVPEVKPAPSEPAPPKVELTPPPVDARVRWPSFALGGAGFAVAFTAAVLAGDAFSASGRLGNANQSQGMAIATRDRANTELSTAIGLATAAFALLVVALVVYPWSSSP